MADGCIYVLAGTNGAGKSSVLGEILVRKGARHYNPDEATRRIQAATPGMTLEQANVAAWNEGREMLERAIEERGNLAIETTLGGETFVGLLERAFERRVEVRMWYVGLASPEFHIARVAARVAKGGHDIPEGRIRERYVRGQLHVIRLMPGLTELRVFDNSADADPDSGKDPRLLLALHVKKGRTVGPKSLASTPVWAKPIVAAALRLRTQKK